MKKIMTTAMLLAFLSGCATTATVQGVQLGKIKNSADLRSITVNGVKETGSQNTKMKSLLENEIKQVVFNKESYFRLVDISDKHLESNIKTQKKQQSAIFGVGRAVLGNATRAQLALSGEVNTNVSQEPYTKVEKERVGCNDLGTNCQYQDKVIQCVKYTAILKADLKLVPIDNASEIAESRHYQKKDSWNTCGDQNRNNSIDITGRFDAYARDIAADFVKRFSPVNKSYKVAFISKLDSALEPEDVELQEFANAISFAKVKRYDKAQEILTGLDKVFEGESYAVAYNLGVIAEVNKNFVEAQAYYRRAENIRAVPDKAINSAVIRVSF